MPHKEANWRIILPDLQATINKERAAAQEWKKVAESRLVFLQHIDKALTIMIGKAASVERVFNVDAPDVQIPEAPGGSSGEEVARCVRAKMSALVTFTGNLAQEALAAEQTMVDVYAIAQEALVTNRPTTDIAPAWSENDFEPSMWGFVKEDVQAALAVSSPLDPPSSALTIISAPEPAALQTGTTSTMLQFLSGQN